MAYLEWEEPPQGEETYFSDMSYLDPLAFPPHVFEKKGGDFVTGDFHDYGQGVRFFSSGLPYFDDAFRDKRRKVCPYFYPGDFSGPFSVSMDVMVSRMMRQPEVMAHDSAWLSVLSVYVQEEGVEYGARALATVNIEPRANGELHAIVYAVRLDGTVKRGLSIPDSPVWGFGRTYRFQLVVDDRTIRLYQQDVATDKSAVLMGYVDMPPGQLLAFRGGHGGIYSGDVSEIELYNSNLRISRLP